MLRVTKVLAAAVIGLIGYTAHAETVYNSIPNPEPGNVPSEGYEATSTSEFGDEVLLGGTQRHLSSVTVAMSNWAMASTYLDPSGNPLPQFSSLAGSLNASGFFHPLTLNLYAVDHTNPTPAAGALIGTKTVNAFINWRPEPDGHAGGDATSYFDPVDNANYHGLITNVTFDMSALNITLPNDVIVSVAYNTSHYGDAPLGQTGPYDSLNVGLGVTPSVGQDAALGTAFVNSSWSGMYGDGGPTGTFRATNAWTDGTPALSISAVPLPASAWAGLALLGLVAGKRVATRFA